MKKILVTTIQLFLEKRVSRMASGLSFSLVFASVPLAIVLFIIVASITQNNALGLQTMDSFLDAISGDIFSSASLFDSGNNLLETINREGILFGIIITIIGIFSFATDIQISFQDIWGLTKKTTTIFQRVMGRIGSVIFIMFAGSLFLVLHIIQIIRNFLIESIPLSWFDTLLAGPWVTITIQIILGTLFITLLFLFYSQNKFSKKQLLSASFIVTLFLLLGQFIISWYLRQPETFSYFVTAQSFIAIMIWMYYSSSIVLIGATLLESIHRKSNTEFVS